MPWLLRLSLINTNLVYRPAAFTCTYMYLSLLLNLVTVTGSMLWYLFIRALKCAVFSDITIVYVVLEIAISLVACTCTQPSQVIKDTSVPRTAYYIKTYELCLKPKGIIALHGVFAVYFFVFFIADTSTPSFGPWHLGITLSGTNPKWRPRDINLSGFTWCVS